MSPLPRPVLATQWDFSDLMPTHGTRRADPVEIPADIEAACIIIVRPTCNLHRRAGRPHLTRRDPEWHRRDPEWHRRHHHGPPAAILPAHECGRPLPGTPHPLEPATTEITDTAPPLLGKSPDMAKISPKLVVETATTSGYRITRAGTVVHITDPNGAIFGEGAHTVSGRLRIFINPLKRHVTTVTDLGAALDEVRAVR